MKDIILQDQKFNGTLSRKNIEKNKPKHIRIKMPKFNDDKILKVARKKKKRTHLYKEKQR